MMAQEEVKQSKKDIDIDTDDVTQEELTVEVKESANNVETKEKPNLDFGEVDLGYTDHGTSEEKKDDKPEIKIEEDKVDDLKKELKAEGKEIEGEKDELADDEKDFQSLYKKYKQQNRRIDKLTFRREEAERQAKAAEEYARGVQKKLQDIEKRYNVESDNYLKEFEARVDSQREQVKSNLKLAIENSDTNAIMEANDQLTQLAVQKEKAKIRAEERKYAIELAETQKKEEEEKVKSQAQQQPTPSEKAMEFREKHKKWFGYDKDPALTAYAVALDGQIRQEGIEVDSDEYYNEIEKRLNPILTAQGLKEPAEAVEAKQKAKPVQTVASAGRKEVGRKTVTLTKSQVAIAKRLGVPLEEYVKYVKEAQ
jgi:DNA repair exonuclease SbcCD ATPase subunit